jgi:uncharacterized protein YktB (UPF0637 family)
MFNKYLEEKQEGMLWDKWLTIYPNMTSDNFVSFEEFKEKHKPKKKLNKKKIDEEVERIRQASKGGER